MSSYSEYLGRLKQRIPKYIDTRPHRDAGHQTEIVKRLAASTVQESLNPAVSGNLVLNAPTTRLTTKWNGVRHVVKDTSLYNAYTAGQAVAQSQMPVNAKPSQIVATCCAPPEINDRMAADAEYAKIIHAKQGLRADCCSLCGKVYDAAVCGCINRVPGNRPTSGCIFDWNLEFMSTITFAEPDDSFLFFNLSLPFYFYGTDYGTGKQIYFSTNFVIGFGETGHDDYEDWNPEWRAILTGFADRYLNNPMFASSAVENQGTLDYYQFIVFAQNYYNDDTPNAINWRYIIGRDEEAGYQYVEIQFNKLPANLGTWTLATGSTFNNLFGEPNSYVPSTCTILLRSDLNGENWELLPGGTLNVPLPGPPPEIT